MDSQRCMEKMSGVLNIFNIEDLSFRKSSFKTANTIYLHFIKPLSFFFSSEIFLEKTFLLFLWAYFTDSTLDLKTENPWLQPKSFFIANKLLCEYVDWVSKEHFEYLDSFWELYRRQLSYQVLEKQWEMPFAYTEKYSDLDCYYEKVIVLLFPAILCQQNYSHKAELLAILKEYYIILLGIDDILDISYDIEFQTMTPILATYYKANGFLPYSSSGISQQIKSTFLSEIKNHMVYLEKLCKQVNVPDYVFQDTINEILSRIQI